MDTPRSSNLLGVVGHLVLLVQESEDYHCRNSDVRAVLQEARRMLASVHRRLKAASKQYVVGFVGLTNVGKSTLLNALLGHDIAPRRNRPCTAAPIEFAYVADGPIVVTTYCKNTFRPRTRQCNCVAQIHEHLEQMADGANPLAGNVDRVVVSLPNSLLASGLVIADTPGFGAAQSDLSHGSHEEALIEYLRNVSQVFWVVLAEQGIGSREKHFHDTFFSHVCDDLIVTGCDDWEPDDCARFRKRFADTLGSRLVRFHFVSGKKGADARTANDAGGLEKAGITSLAKRLQELADPAGREAVVRNELDQLARDIAWWFSEYRDRRGRPLPHWWRPDSWYRFAAFATGAPFGGSLKKNLEQPP